MITIQFKTIRASTEPAQTTAAVSLSDHDKVVMLGDDMLIITCRSNNNTPYNIPAAYIHVELMMEEREAWREIGYHLYHCLTPVGKYFGRGDPQLVDEKSKYPR